MLAAEIFTQHAQRYSVLQYIIPVSTRECPNHTDPDLPGSYTFIY